MGKIKERRKKRSERKSQELTSKVSKTPKSKQQMKPRAKGIRGLTEWKVTQKNFTRREHRGTEEGSKVEIQIRKSKDILKVVNFSLIVPPEARKKEMTEGRCSKTQWLNRAPGTAAPGGGGGTSYPSRGSLKLSVQPTPFQTVSHSCIC